MEYLGLTPGYRTALADGTLVADSPKHMATEEFYKAYKGSRLHLCEEGYLYAAAIFSQKRNPAYIYSYAYQPEENWASYTQNLTPESYGREDYVFDQECWFRVCVRRADGADMNSQDYARAGEMIEYHRAAAEEAAGYHRAAAGEITGHRRADAGEVRTVSGRRKPWFESEIKQTAASIQRGDGPDVMKLCILTDTHYTINGTWEDTVSNIYGVARRVRYDAVVHLGDFTDGMLPKRLTRKYVRGMIRDLENCGAPLYIVPGNHDFNYFQDRRNAFSSQEMKGLYRLYGDSPEQMKMLCHCGDSDEERENLYLSCGDSNGSMYSSCNGETELDYYIDIPRFCVRMIFLSSFEDKAPIRYGYTKKQLQWLREVLQSSVSGTRFLIFSHDAPLAKLDYWSFYIRNGEELLDILEEYNAKEEYQVAGFFYGHTHADYVFEECGFPVISIGCAKLEYFQDKKPEGSTAWFREADTVTQDLWDSLLVDFKNQRLKLVRFGAGEDREVSFAKKKSIYKDVAVMKRKNRSMKVWAHRGASAHAPENTLPAFELAHRLGADGIELDVQLTRDGIPVVIHDERVDRVSGVSGYVKDYTLEELKKLNVNRNFPAYGSAAVPTLAEVYDLVKKTDLTVNLELKNSSIFYEGLEEKVLKLACEKGLEDRLVYSSFNHYSMRRLKQLLPAARIAFLYCDGILDIADYAGRHGAYAVHPSAGCMKYPGADVANACHANGVRVHVWTVNEKADFEKMRDLGADAVITNYVERGI